MRHISTSMMRRVKSHMLDMGFPFIEIRGPVHGKCMIGSQNLSQSNLDVCDDHQSALTCANMEPTGNHTSASLEI